VKDPHLAVFFAIVVLVAFYRDIFGRETPSSCLASETIERALLLEESWNDDILKCLRFLKKDGFTIFGPA
jgi:hypothetical protein